MSTILVPAGTSLTAAQSEVRSRLRAGLDTPLRVELAAGVWELDQPLDFGPEDSGTPACPVTWCSAPGGRAVLSGGRRLGGWHVGSHAGRAAWTVDLPQVASAAWWLDIAGFAGKLTTVRA